MKALLLRHGLHFGYHKRIKGKYILITLKDGKVISFTKTELYSINSRNQISFARPADPKGRAMIDKIREHVEISFAVLVRNLQIRGYAGKELTESAAIKMLTKEGSDTMHFHSLLGLNRKSSRPLTRRNYELIKHKRNILLFNSRHITISSHGYYEDFGKAVKLGDQPPLLLKEKATHFFEIK